jgi:long-subunit acyl-CoA synthetase (AMP-forming)
LKFTVRNQIAAIWKDKKISYTEFFKQSAMYASLYADIKPDKVAVFSPNRPEWIFAFFSIWLNRATAVPIDFMSLPGEVAYILNDSRPEVIFIPQEYVEIFDKIESELLYPIKVIIFRRDKRRLRRNLRPSTSNKLIWKKPLLLPTPQEQPAIQKG